MTQKRNPVVAGRASRRNFAATNFQVEDRLFPPTHQQVRHRDLNAEARIQASVVEWIRVVAPELLAFAVPNGGYRTLVEAARMRWTGAVPGVPDLCIVAPGGGVHFIEVKTATGRLSGAQRNIHETLAALGTTPAIVRSIDDARAAFRVWGFETLEAAMSAERARAAMRSRWSQEFRDGARCGFLRRFDGEREMGGYPDGDEGGFVYRLEQAALDQHPEIFASRAVWGDTVEGSARDALAEVEQSLDERRPVEKAKDFLHDLLADGPIGPKQVKSAAWR
jgi:hypothetical protein